VDLYLIVLVLVGQIALVVLGCGAVYALLQSALRRAFVQQQQTIEERLSVLADTLKTLEKQSAPAPAPVPVAAQLPEKSSEVAPEILAVLAAAATAFLGMKVRVRGARAMQPPNIGVNPWSQQGRVFIQASHNLRLRG
jgi:hypothetical protein